MNRPACIVLILGLAACDEKRTSSSDQKQSAEQERILQEGTSQVGMPAITNFFERKQLKAIYELRDQGDLATYTYLVSDMTGELRFFCNSIGYGIPYATQFTNPEKINTDWNQRGFGMVTLPQADPNGLFSPSSADGTWVLCKDPNGTEVQPVFVEPRLIVSPFPMERGSGKAEAPGSKTP